MVWMITLKEKYCYAILSGRKKMELRTRKPKELHSGDAVLVCMKGSHGHVPFYFTVDAIACCSPRVMWTFNKNVLAIDEKDYKAYTKGKSYVYGIRIRQVCQYATEVTIDDFGVHKAPQWFTVVPCAKTAMIVGSGKGA